MITLRRASLGRANGVDITVANAKGFARFFAPTWDMVLGVKHGRMSPEEYTRRYLKILRANRNKEAWKWLRDQAVDGTLTFLCFCRDGEFCHTYLLIDYMVSKWPGYFCK